MRMSACTIVEAEICGLIFADVHENVTVDALRLEEKCLYGIQNISCYLLF